MLYGLCMICDNPHTVCKYYNAIRILEWVKDTKKYQKERLVVEINVTVDLLPFEVGDDDDYTPDNVDDITL